MLTGNIDMLHTEFPLLTIGRCHKIQVFAWLILATFLAISCSAEKAELTPQFDKEFKGDSNALRVGENYRSMDADWDKTTIAASLVAAAEREGEVRWSGYSQDQIQAWCLDFSKEFRVKCSGRAISAGQIVTTLATEHQAGSRQTDVVYLSMSQMAQYLDRGLGAQVQWDGIGVTPGRAWASEGNGTAVGTIQSQYANFVNTKIIPVSQAPRTVFDWLDPQWEALICAPDFLLRAGNGFLGLLYDPDEMVRLHTSIIELRDPVITSDCNALLLSGERPLTYMGYGHPSELIDTGYIEPFWNAGMGVNLFSHSVAVDARNPNAGRLFAAWATSRAASESSWETIGQGWTAFGHGPEGLISGQFADLSLVYESPVTFKERGIRTRYFQEQVFGKGR